MNKQSPPYQALCAEYYELDKPTASEDALQCYLEYAKEAKGPILEPMCGTGRFFIPLLEKGYSITGFDFSSHMLDICRRKCKERGLMATLIEATFENFSLQRLYKLIFIPSGSFCLLTNPKQVKQALKFIFDHLYVGGKFVFDVETLKALSNKQGIWKGNWVNKPDGSKLVINTLSSFNKISRIETILCRYELWEENKVSQTEIENIHLKLYEIAEIEQLLEQHGLKVLHRWQAEPYSKLEASDDDAVILYECIKL